MKSHIKILALAVALSPAAAFAQAPSTPAGSTPPTFPSGQQTTGGDHDRDNQTQQLPRMGDADDQARQDRDRDGQYGSVNQATASNVQSVIQQRLPNSNIAVNVANGNSLVLTGAVPSDRERVYVEQLARQQAPNVNIINQITTANAQGSGGYGTGGAVGSATVPSTTGTYGSSSGAVGSGVDRDRDRDRQSGVATPDNDRDRQSGGADVDRDRDRDRDQSSATSGDRDRDRDNMSAQSDQDKDRKDKDNGKHKGQHKKDKDKDKKKDHDKKDKDERDRDQQQSPQSPR